MPKRRKKCVVDTNVPKTANLALDPAQIRDELKECVGNCVEVMTDIVYGRRDVVVDREGELFEEYLGELNLSGQPGLGDKFMKWLHDRQYSFSEKDRVSITPQGDSYAEFPDHKVLAGFDPSDRKFIAVANAHPERPPILQATDSKWWGYKVAFETAGLTVDFLCENYVQKKYLQKMGRNGQ